MFFASLIVLLFAYVHLSVQADFEGARNSLRDAQVDAEAGLLEALADADASVLIQALSELKQIYEAGFKDIAYLESFEASGDKEAALSASLAFWKRKMHDVLQPYTSNPESFKGVVISDETPLKDPDWNNTAAYKKAEEEIEGKVKEAVASLRKEYEELTKEKPSQLEEVTRYSWRRAASGLALEAAIASIRSQGQRSKHDAANGKTEKGMSWLDRIILTSSANFKANVHDIYSSS